MSRPMTFRSGMREDGTMSEPTEAQIEAAIRVLREEMPSMAYSAHVGDYLAEGTEVWSTAGLAALRAADEEADRMNRDLVRRALKAAIGGGRA